MRLIHTKTTLPKYFINHPDVVGLLEETDISIGSSRIKAKLLIFDTSSSLRVSCKNMIGIDLEEDVRGAVNNLIKQVFTFNPKGAKHSKVVLEADPRYFCVIFLCKEWLSVEVITHESVHAAFSYTKRMKRTPWSYLTDVFQEEELCYPAGYIAASIVKFINTKGLYQ